MVTVSKHSLVLVVVGVCFFELKGTLWSGKGAGVALSFSVSVFFFFFLC